MTIQTPAGPLKLVMNEDGSVRELRFGADSEGGSPHPEIARQIAEYFAGERQSFEFRLAPDGTDFQKRVWEELTRIPYGETISYAELARRVGRPGAARAVGRANATNPIAIVVPCHRVIGANGSLTGYAYGMEMKRTLLDLERGQAKIAISA